VGLEAEGDVATERATLCACRHTVFKSYVCDFSQTVLSGLLTPQRGYWIGCNTTEVRNDQGQSGGYCRLGLRLQVCSLGFRLTPPLWSFPLTWTMYRMLQAVQSGLGSLVA
jgi:hypothetical protein